MWRPDHPRNCFPVFSAGSAIGGLGQTGLNQQNVWRVVTGQRPGNPISQAGLKFPIIFMTAVDNPAILGQVTQLGCIACLRKPFSADQLIEAIIKALG